MIEQPPTKKRKRWPWIAGGIGLLTVIGALSDRQAPVPGTGGPSKVASAAKEPVIKQIGEDIYAMIIDPKDNADLFPKYARDACGSAKQCIVMGWTDTELAGRAMPLTEREADGMVFHYGLNRFTEHERNLWKCSIFPRKSNDECMAKSER